MISDPLGRDLGAREDAIGGGAEHREAGRPFLDRMPLGDARDQRQHRPRQPEEDAGRQHHVQAEIETMW